MKKRIVPIVVTAILVIGIFTPLVFADGALTVPRFEAIGRIDVVASGVGLQGETDGTINLIIPTSGNSEVIAAYLYWSGYDPISGGDDEVDFEGTTVTVLDSFGPDLWYDDYYTYVYVADVTSDVQPGDNTYTIEDVEFIRNFGAGLIAVYHSDDLPLTEVIILDGLDNFWFGWPDLRGPNSQVTSFTFDPAPISRTAEMILFAGATEHDDRPNKLWNETGTGSAPLPTDNLITAPSTADGDYPFVGSDGPSWDTYMADVSIPADDEWVAIQVESVNTGDAGPDPPYDGRGTSGILIAGGFVLPVRGSGKVTGGGQISVGEGKKDVGSFGFNAMWYSRDEGPKGELQYLNHMTNELVHAHIVDYLIVWEYLEGNKPMPLQKAYFYGPCTLNHVEGYRFELYVEDDGEPKNPDFFDIKVYDGSDILVLEDSNDLLHGNIQIHKPPK